MHRLTLENTAYEGNNNAYLFDGDETVLVDTGIALSGPREQLRRALATHEVTFGDVDAIYLTHFHADHSGLAGEIQRESGASVSVHPDDAPLVEGDEDAQAALRDRQRTSFDEWGMPRETRDALVAYMDDRPDRYGEDVDVDLFDHGDRFDVGATTLEVVSTPGHTLGHVSFALADRDEVLTGDALLPKYTPNVGGADVRVDRPLERYLATLRSLVDADYDRAWSGHRGPIDDPTARATDIIDHHRERAWRIVRFLADGGPADAWTVSAELFGSLEKIHVLHGPGEAHAHLDHLLQAGDLEQHGRAYRLTDDARERFENTTEQHWPL